MPIISKTLHISTEDDIWFYNLTPDLQTLITASAIQNGQILIFSRHTTTAVAVNEWEERLLEDLKKHLRRLAPPSEKYLHNDLHLRIVPPDEPENAHSHLMALMLNNSEVIPIVNGKLMLGTYQAALLVELDGPRQRTVHIQVSGE